MGEVKVSSAVREGFAMACGVVNLETRLMLASAEKKSLRKCLLCEGGIEKVEVGFSGERTRRGGRGDTETDRVRVSMATLSLAI